LLIRVDCLEIVDSSLLMDESYQHSVALVLSAWKNSFLKLPVVRASRWTLTSSYLLAVGDLITIASRYLLSVLPVMCILYFACPQFENKKL